MVTALSTPHPIPYQPVLRTIGALLDEREAWRATVVEVPDGMVVRYERGDGTVGMCHVPFADLLSAGGERAATRISGTRERPVRVPRYQDTLRALGYQLEQVHAFAILLDEGDWGFVVTYQQEHPLREDRLQKETLLVGPADQHALCELARQRRRPPRA